MRGVLYSYRAFVWDLFDAVFPCKLKHSNYLSFVIIGSQLFLTLKKIKSQLQFSSLD